MRIKRVEATWVSMPITAAQQHRSDFGQVKTVDAALLRNEDVVKAHAQRQ